MSKDRVKTKKVVKRRLKIKGVLLLALILASIFFSIKYLFKIEVKSITVVGNEYVKDSAIIKDAGLNEKITYLGFKSSDVCSSLKKNKLISTCKVRRNLDFTISIVVEENVPLFFYSTDGAIVLSDKTRMTGANTYGIPTLINYTPEDVLNEFIDGLADIKGDIIRSISEIEYAPSTSKDGVPIDSERFVLSMNDGNTVYVNNKRLSILGYYDKIYASLGDKKGIYNFDCDFDNYLFTEYGE